MTTVGTRENRISEGTRRSGGRDVVRIVVTNKEYGELCRASIGRLPRSSRSKLSLLTFQSWNEVAIPPTPRRTSPTVFVSRLADVVADAAKKSRQAGRAKHLLFSEGLPVEAVASRLPRLDVRDANRVHVARGGDAESISEIIHRLFSAIAQPKASLSILDAWVESDELVLLAPGFERLSVPLRRLRKFIGESRKEIRAFEIDEDGRFLFWPHADVHLGWEQMKQILDPAAAVAAEKKSEEFNRRYGLAIRRLREETSLKQSEIDGLTERHVRRIEQGRQSVTSSALRALAKAHDMPVEEYLREIAERIETRG